MFERFDHSMLRRRLHRPKVIETWPELGKMCCVSLVGDEDTHAAYVDDIISEGHNSSKQFQTARSGQDMLRRTRRRPHRFQCGNENVVRE
ncbi:transporter [Anopheles sinensis]|uniref:Transporter n=1 Tax=Anopheles sinensis TaxID=74873 RepID=A0A084WM89_ANOSI|nr:transporter [Anopheles sinensis]